MKIGSKQESKKAELRTSFDPQILRQALHLKFSLPFIEI